MLRDDPPDDGPGDEKGEDPRDRAAEEEEDDDLICATCEQPISSTKEVFVVGEGSAVHVYPNPYGHLREIVTVARAHNLKLDGIAYLDFTWFDGFAWRIAYCDGCGGHLGWRYEATEAHLSPQTFFGLLTKAIRER